VRNATTVQSRPSQLAVHCLSKKESMNRIDEELIEAAQENNLPEVSRLLSVGADIESKDKVFFGHDASSLGLQRRTLASFPSVAGAWSRYRGERQLQLDASALCTLPAIPAMWPLSSRCLAPTIPSIPAIYESRVHSFKVTITSQLAWE
jgi:hypothetical protein